MTLALVLTLTQFISPGCQRIDASLPAQFIRYDSLGELSTRGETRYRVFLRLQNNTNCVVHYGEEGTEGQVGRHRIKYYVADRSFRLTPGLDSDDIAPRALAPGASIVFDVPQYHFHLNRIVLVPVRYDWEQGSADIWNARHVTFDASQIPDEARKRLRR
jgi:hypothetical protein